MVKLKTKALCCFNLLPNILGYIVDASSGDGDDHGFRCSRDRAHLNQ